MSSCSAFARRVGTADVVDAMGRLHQHRCDLLDLVSPMPCRVLFGPAVRGGSAIRRGHPERNAIHVIRN
jgi:hypothetical protein